MTNDFAASETSWSVRDEWALAQASPWRMEEADLHSYDGFII